MRDDGFTLFELLIVLALLGMILLIVTPLTLQNIRRARADNQTQTLYGNFAEARQRAVQRNKTYLIQIAEGSVYVYEDLNEDGIADANEKVNLLSADGLVYPLKGTVGGTAISATAQLAVASRKGFIQPSATIYVDQDAPHNCVFVDFTRVSIGRYNGSVCQVQ